MVRAVGWCAADHDYEMPEAMRAVAGALTTAASITERIGRRVLIYDVKLTPAQRAVLDAVRSGATVRAWTFLSGGAKRWKNGDSRVSTLAVDALVSHGVVRQERRGEAELLDGTAEQAEIREDLGGHHRGHPGTNK